MSHETEGQPAGDKEDETSAVTPQGEIEDELSPIDTMELLSRAGLSGGKSTDRAHETPPLVEAADPSAFAEASADKSAARVAEGGKGPPAESEPAQEQDAIAVAEPPETPAFAKASADKMEEALGEEAVDAESEEFDRLLEQYLERIHDFSSGDIIDAEIVDVKRTYVLVDVGDKAEGVIDIGEFVDTQGEIHVAVGDTIPVQILGRDSESGQVHVSHRRAVSELAWQRVCESVHRQIPLTGRVAQAVRAGLIVDVGVPAFMPASQIDTSRVENLSEWLNREVAAYVIDLDRTRRRVVLSRRKLVREDDERKRRRILESLEPGQERVVRIKRILDFGAFADLGGLDGLIPREEVSWERGAHPRDYLREGRDLKVHVLSVDLETGRVALSRKRVRPDPWEKIEEKYTAQRVVKGRVVRVTDFGAFISLEEGVCGMIHTSDLSWTGGRKRVQDFLRVGDTVKAVVIETDKERRRMSLGLKQITMDPWVEVEEKFPPGTTIKGSVTALASYGAFVRVTEHVEGLIHISDMAWEKKPKAPSHYVQVGQEVEAVVLKTERERRRISLGLKQMTKSPFERFVGEHPVGSDIRGKVTRLTSFGAFVQLAPEVEGLIHISQLDERRIENPDEAVRAGQTVEAKILKIDLKSQKIALSRRAYLKEQESRQVASYMNQSFSGGLKMGELLRELDIRPVDADDNSDTF